MTWCSASQPLSRAPEVGFCNVTVHFSRTFIVFLILRSEHSTAQFLFLKWQILWAWQPMSLQLLSWWYHNAFTCWSWPATCWLINTFHSGALKLKSSSLHMFLCKNISADNCTRELFKSSKDSTSLHIYNEKTFFDFVFRVFCEWHYKWSSFRPSWPTSSNPRPKPLGGSILLKFFIWN